MRRRFNYTGRQRISQDAVLIAVDEDRPVTFDAAFDLGEYDFPPDAQVIVEAYRQRFYSRFEFGTVADIRPPMDRRIEGAEGHERIYFRLKIVDTDEAVGRILGLADELSPDTEAETEKRGIFPVWWSTEAGDAVWRVNYEARNRPVLELNSLIEGIREAFQHEPAVRALILPAALKDVLNHIAFVEESLTAAPDEGWEGEWLKFISRFHPSDPPPPDASKAERHRWVENALDAFCDRFNPRQLFESR